MAREDDAKASVSEVARLAQTHDADAARLHQAVRAARQLGATWKELSRALGLSKPEAKRVYGPPDTGE